MEADDLQLAISYSDLASSLAWQDFMRFQNAECERLELAALNATGTIYARLEAQIAWQQRRLVVRTFQETVRESKEAIKNVELEEVDARTDRASRANW